MEDNFELTGINYDELDEAGKQIYDTLNKNFREAWLKKNNERAEKTRETEVKMTKLQSDLTEAHTALAAYYDWYQNTGQYLTENQQQQVMNQTNFDPNQLVRTIQQLEHKVENITNNYERQIQELRAGSDQTRGVLDMAMRLNELRFKHKDRDVDLSRITQVMKERQINDPDLAFNVAYDEELRRELVDKEVNSRLDEERKKLEAERNLVDVEANTYYQPPVEPKSYTQASQALLEKLRQGG
jgi:hypothetical protein